MKDLPQSQLDVVSDLETDKRSVFSSVSQARQYRELLFFLKNGPEVVLTMYLDNLFYREHSKADGWRRMSLKCLKNLIQFFFVDAGESNWINCPQILLIVEYCI